MKLDAEKVSSGEIVAAFVLLSVCNSDDASSVQSTVDIVVTSVFSVVEETAAKSASHFVAVCCSSNASYIAMLSLARS